LKAHYGHDITSPSTILQPTANSFHQTMAVQPLFRAKLVLPVLFAFLLTPFPRQLGLYESLSHLHPFFVGLLPFFISSEEQWGFTFQQLYGDGGHSDIASKKQYRNRLWGQTALVTGANSGIGYEISLALARLGVSVTMTCRSPSRCEAAAKRIREDEIVVRRGDEDRGLVNPGSAVVTMTIDTSSLRSVKTFCHEFQARTDDGEGNPLPLDMLFLNAGIGFAGNADDGSLLLSEDGIEMTFATNVVGHHLMYRLLEPSIRRSDALRKTPARIVQTSSSMTYINMLSYNVATDLETLNSVRGSLYAQSKLAQILWAKELTTRLDVDANNNISSSSSNSDAFNPNSIVYANAAHPGVVATNIWHEKEFVTLPWKESFLKKLARVMQSLMWTSEEGALTLIYLGTAVEELQKDNVRGRYFHPQTKLMKDHKLLAKDNEQETKILQEKLWKFLDELVADFV
jgi:NAD(P)-dependent dehydrogenase (short-subunit alcohol dehydrogenase family)